jgi:hypothetical protein
MKREGAARGDVYGRLRVAPWYVACETGGSSGALLPSYHSLERGGGTGRYEMLTTTRRGR